MKRIICFLLSIILLISCVPIASAEESVNTDPEAQSAEDEQNQIHDCCEICDGHDQDCCETCSTNCTCDHCEDCNGDCAHDNCEDSNGQVSIESNVEPQFPQVYFTEYDYCDDEGNAHYIVELPEGETSVELYPIIESTDTLYFSWSSLDTQTMDYTNLNVGKQSLTVYPDDAILGVDDYYREELTAENSFGTYIFTAYFTVVRETEIVQITDHANSLFASGACTHNSEDRTYKSLNNVYHITTYTCSKCGNSRTASEKHTFSDGVCTLCTSWQAYSANGSYDVINSSGVKLYSQPVTSGTSTVKKTVAMGTHLAVEEVTLTTANNYWGKVVKIGTTKQTTTMYVYMGRGSLKPHTHGKEITYSTSNNIQHNTITTCQACGYSTTKKENHSFNSSGVCTLCKSESAYTTAGSYLTVADNTQLWTERVSSGTSKVAKTLSKGVHLSIDSISPNSANNYWGQVKVIGSSAQSDDMYVYMGRGTVKPHTHDLVSSYSTNSDLQHNKTSRCSVCGYSSGTFPEDHSFSGNTCKYCGFDEVPHATGEYVTIRQSEPLKSKPYADSSTVVSVGQGTYIYISSFDVNDYNNYCGKVSQYGGTATSQTMYVYMGYLSSHRHSFSNSYSYSSNVNHNTKSTCACGYSKTVKEPHIYSGDKCTCCEGIPAHTTNGSYLVVDTKGVPVYSQRLSSGTSTIVKTLPKGTHIMIDEIMLNSVDYYWGKITMIGSTPVKPAEKMFVYMSAVALEKHTHSISKHYTTQSDQSHTVKNVCSVCAFSEEKTEDHSFSGGECELCGQTQTPKSKGGYVTIRTSEPLRTDVYADSTLAQSVPAGTYIEISDVAPNKYNNYWGKVSKIDDSAVSKTMYAYMGNLKAHTHSMVISYENKNNSTHIKKELCQGCNINTQVDQSHTFINGVCSKCGAWEPYTSNGGYIIVSADNVPLYSERASGGTSKKLKELPENTYIEVTDVFLSTYGYYWGRVTKIGNDNQSTVMYVYMGRGQVMPHAHTLNTKYTNTDNAVHEKNTTCSGCVCNATVRESHTFVNGACSKCGAWEPYTSGGDYITVDEESVPLYSERASGGKSKVLKELPKNTYIEVVEVMLSAYGYYWGRVSKIGNDSQSSKMYVYMGRGQVAPHTHSTVGSYTQKSDIEHYAGMTCSVCGYMDDAKSQAHSFENGSCKYCGKVETPMTAGAYLTTRISEPLRSGMYADSSAVQSVPQGAYILVSSVAVNKYDNYWGKVAQIGGIVPTTTMYVYMGNLAAHTHNYEESGETVNNVQHRAKYVCSGCTCTKTELENHSFDANGKCVVCNTGEAYSSAGSYITVDDRVPLYSERLSSKTSRVLKYLDMNTHIKVDSIELNSANNYWGIVTMIGNSVPDKDMYVYMGRGSVAPHRHTMENGWSTASDTEHIEGLTCSVCAYTEASIRQEHVFENGACVKCGATEVPKVSGDYVTHRETEALRSDIYADSSAVRNVPTGTCVRINTVSENKYGNYWGCVESIDGVRVSEKMYAYMGNLTPHTHSSKTEYSNLNNMKHIAQTSCSTCSTAYEIEEAHDYVNGVCTYCGAWEPNSANGGYIVVNSDGVNLYSERLSTGSSKVLRLLLENTYLEVSSITLNGAGNYWGKVTKIGNAATSRNMYVYMGSGQLQPHKHTNNAGYKTINNLQHGAEFVCPICGSSGTVTEDHSFDGNGVCTLCGTHAAHTTAGTYITTNSEGVQLYSARLSSGSSKVLDTLEKGTCVIINSVLLNSAKNYWGKVMAIGPDGTAPAKTMYIYMGEGSLKAHTHTMVSGYNKVSDKEHESVESCTECGYRMAVTKQAHVFENGVCTLCGAAEVSTSAGGYVTLRESEPLKSQMSADSATIQSVPAGTFITVSEVKANKYNNYWGKVSYIDDTPVKKTMYVYMGKLQVHNEHTMEPYCTMASNMQHSIGTKCAVCSYTIEDSLEAHSFVNGVCTICGADKTADETGGYVTTVESVPLKSGAGESAKTLQTVPLGTYIFVSSITVSNYDNYWGKVSRIDNTYVKKTLYVYMGCLAAHGSHTMVNCSISKSDMEHSNGKKCSGCNLIELGVTEPHRFENNVCVACGKAEVATTIGGYLTFRDSEVLRASASKDAKAVKTVSKGTFINVSSIVTNKYKNLWGKVSYIDSTEIKSTMYVYMGNLTAHEHTIIETFIPADDDMHNIISSCEGCAFTATVKQPHIVVDGKCLNCGQKAPETKSKGDYETPAQVSLYLDINLKKSAGIIVPENYLVCVSSTKKTSDGVYSGRVSKYGNVTCGSDKLYVKMSELRPHTTHTDLRDTYTKCDAYHNAAKACNTVGCTEKYRDRAVAHTFQNGVCTLCGHPQVSTENGAYKVSSNDVTVRASNSLTGKALATAKKGSLIVVDNVMLNDSTGNYWGEVIWLNNQRVSSKSKQYVYMGSLDEFEGSFNTSIVGSDNDYHYINDCGMVFPEQHSWVDGYCSVCHALGGSASVGMYLTNETVGAYNLRGSKMASTTQKYPENTVLQINQIVFASGYYGKVAKCNGVTEKKALYVPLGSLSFHGEHAPDAVTFTNKTDTQHVRNVKCPICGENSQIYENHVYENGVCKYCDAAQPITASNNDYFVLTKDGKVYSSTSLTSKVTETFLAGSIITVAKVTAKSGNYWGSGVKLLVDGKLRTLKGYVHMSSAELALHEHTWKATTVCSHDESIHTTETVCSVCGYVLRSEKQHTYVDGVCTCCNAMEVERFIGDYLVRSESVNAYSSLSKTTVKMKLHKGDYVVVQSVSLKNGVYYGLVKSANDKNIATVYVPMNALKQHFHQYNDCTVNSTRDDHHEITYTCTLCTHAEKTEEKHINLSGKCQICGKTVTADEPGFYLAADDLTVYKKPLSTAAKVSKNSSIDMGTHLYINKVETNEYGNYWGNVVKAGNKSYSGSNWVYMGSLTAAGVDSISLTYKSINNTVHSIKAECGNCKFSYTLHSSHNFSNSGKCSECDKAVIEAGTYYTTRSDCPVYRPVITTSGTYTNAGSIKLAGTALKVMPNAFLVAQDCIYCHCQDGVADCWVKYEDIVNHIHMGTSVSKELDDEYHSVTELETASICTVCGIDLPEKRIKREKEEHTYINGVCSACGKAEVCTQPGNYYVPFSGFCARKDSSEFSNFATVYAYGDKINVEKVVINEGAFWGRVKNTKEYVMMKLLLTDPPQKNDNYTPLTDEELVNWCVHNFGGNALYTYGYYSETLSNIDNADLLLIAACNRASSISSQVFTWIKNARGETLANEYYQNQIISVMQQMDEAADYGELTLKRKDDIKNVIKAIKNTGSGIEEYKKLSKTDKNALDKVLKYLGTAENLMKLGEIGYDFIAYAVSDFSNMQQTIDAVKAMKDPDDNNNDFQKALDDVVAIYEGKWYVMADEALLDIVEIYFDKIIQWRDGDILILDQHLFDDVANKLMGKSLTTLLQEIGWSDFGYIYKIANFAVDVLLKYSSGKELSKKTLQFISQLTVMASAKNTYDAAVERVCQGDRSLATLASVRCQFTLYKTCVIELYNIMLDMEYNHVFGIHEDSTLKSYLQYEIDKIETVYLVNDYSEYVNAISYEEYKMMH